MPKPKVIYRKGRRIVLKNQIELTKHEQHMLCRKNLKLIREQIAANEELTNGKDK